MIPREKRPVAPAWADGPKYLNNPIVAQRFPLCELRGCRIVDRLPLGCPLATADPLGAILVLKDRGWQRAYGRALSDLAGGQADLAHAATCDACHGRNRGNPHVIYLRGIAAADTSRVPHRTQVSDTAGGVSPAPVSITSRRTGGGRR